MPSTSAGGTALMTASGHAPVSGSRETAAPLAKDGAPSVLWSARMSGSSAIASSRQLSTSVKEALKVPAAESTLHSVCTTMPMRAIGGSRAWSEFWMRRVCSSVSGGAADPGVAASPGSAWPFACRGRGGDFAGERFLDDGDWCDGDAFLARAPPRALDVEGGGVAVAGAARPARAPASA